MLKAIHMHAYVHASARMHMCMGIYTLACVLAHMCHAAPSKLLFPQASMHAPADSDLQPHKPVRTHRGQIVPRLAATASVQFSMQSSSPQAAPHLSHGSTLHNHIPKLTQIHKNKMSMCTSYAHIRKHMHPLKPLCTHPPMCMSPPQYTPNCSACHQASWTALHTLVDNQEMIIAIY